MSDLKAKIKENENKKESNRGKLRKTLGYVLPFFMPYKLEMIWVTVLMLLSSSFEPALALVSKQFVEYVFINRDMDILPWIPGTIIALALVRATFNFLYKYDREVMCLKVVQDLRMGMYHHFMHLSMDYYERTSTGEMMSRTQGDVVKLQSAVPAVIDMCRQVVKLAALSAVCVYQDWKLSFLAMLVIPVTVYPMITIGKAMKRYTKKGMKQIAVIHTILQETYSGAKVVKAFGMENEEVKNYLGANIKMLGLNVRYARFKIMNSPVMNIIGSLGIAAIVYLGAKHIITGQIEPGALISYMVAVGFMFEPIREISDANAELQTSYAAAERVIETLSRQPTVEEAHDAIVMPSFSREIRYQNVFFKYFNDYVLEDFSLKAGKGELIALVGGSGAGKTTVVNLLPRFYDVSEGSITIDGVDIRKSTLRSLREQIGVVTQETFLFNTTVTKNICYGSGEKPIEAVMDAARAANAHEFIMRLPKAYDTIIGERGVRLSGGERQRIAIARALLKNPPILILDEATSSLDTEAEREVQKALDVLMQERTTIAIAHRLSTVRHADRILLLGGGRVIEEGRHEELLAKNGAYARLYNMQFFLGEFETNHRSASRGSEALV